MRATFCCATAGKGAASAANIASALSFMASRLVKGDANNLCMSISLGFPHCYISGCLPVSTRIFPDAGNTCDEKLRGTMLDAATLLINGPPSLAFTTGHPVSEFVAPTQPDFVQAIKHRFAPLGRATPNQEKRMNAG